MSGAVSLSDDWPLFSRHSRFCWASLCVFSSPDFCADPPFRARTMIIALSSLGRFEFSIVLSRRRDHSPCAPVITDEELFFFLFLLPVFIILASRFPLFALSLLPRCVEGVRCLLYSSLSTRLLFSEACRASSESLEGRRRRRAINHSMMTALGCLLALPPPSSVCISQVHAQFLSCVRTRLRASHPRLASIQISTHVFHLPLFMRVQQTSFLLQRTPMHVSSSQSTFCS